MIHSRHANKYLHIWKILLPKRMSKQNKTDMDNRLVVTRREGLGWGEMANESQIYGDGWKADFGGEQAIVYTDII